MQTIFLQKNSSHQTPSIPTLDISSTMDGEIWDLENTNKQSAMRRVPSRNPNRSVQSWDPFKGHSISKCAAQKPDDADAVAIHVASCLKDLFINGKKTYANRDDLGDGIGWKWWFATAVKRWSAVHHLGRQGILSACILHITGRIYLFSHFTLYKKSPLPDVSQVICLKRDPNTARLAYWSCLLSCCASLPRQIQSPEQ